MNNFTTSNTTNYYYIKTICTFCGKDITKESKHNCTVFTNEYASTKRKYIKVRKPKIRKFKKNRNI